MIENHSQYQKYLSKRDNFVKNLERLESQPTYETIDEILINSLRSYIETFDREILEYKKRISNG
jgi:hypothetical protein